jgi:carnitine-CoA ligase
LGNQFASTSELLTREAAVRPKDEPFAYCSGRSMSTFELNRNASHVANSLIMSGIQKGQSVAVIAHNSLDYLSVEFGILKAGAVVVPLNCLLKRNEFSYLLENSEAKFVFAHRDYLKECQSSIEELCLPYCVMGAVGEKNSLSSMLQTSSSLLPDVKVGYDDIAFILYTSGTTGLPKGVVYEQYAILPNNNETYVQLMHEAYGLSSKDTTYLPFALYHILGQVHLISALRNGGKIALAEKFSASNFWNEVKEYKATIVVHQAASIPLLLKQPASSRDKDHNVRVSVGAGVPNETVWRDFENRFGVKIFEHYAQTEGAFFGAGTMPTNKIGTIGKPFGVAEVRIVDESGNNARSSDPGQLISRLKEGYARKKPEELYFKDPERGLARFTSDGWFKSGDIVKQDEQGYLHYVGKVETFIRYRGENISPLQIESIVSAHPQVAECIALGVPNQELGGDDIKIVISPKPGEKISVDEFFSWCTLNLPKFMVPRYLLIVSELLKTEHTKKILRSAYQGKSQENIFDRFQTLSASQANHERKQTK